MTSEKFEMDDRQKLFPQLIYRINKHFPSIIRLLNNLISTKNEPDVPLSALFFFFDPHTRVFNSLHVDRWTLCDVALKNFISFLNNPGNRDHWEIFKSKFNSNEKRALKTINRSIIFLEENFLNLDETKEINPSNLTETYINLLNLFEHYPQEKNRNLDGTFYRIFEKLRNENTWKIKFATVKLLYTDVYEKSFSKYPPIEIEFFSNKFENAECLMFAFQENEQQYDDKEDFYKEIEKQKKKGEIEYIPNFYDNYLSPYLLNWNVGEKPFLLENWFDTKSLSFDDFSYNLIIPFYDAYFDGRQCGNLRSNLTVTLNQQDFNDVKKIKNIAKKIIEKFRAIIIQEITAARIFEILQQEMDSSIIEFFIKHITLLQDWDRIIFFNIQRHKNAFSYKRSKLGHWEKEDNPKILVPDQFKKLNIYHEYSIDIKTNKKTWINYNYLFNSQTIGDIDIDEEKKFPNYALMFEYPLSTVFPCCKNNEEIEMVPPLWNFYANQMIEVMRQIRLKKKVIIDTSIHGAKSAAAGIMTRNMSHNIASHILAYWVEKDIAESVKLIGETKSESNLLLNASEILTESKKLFQYLQQRMDFLAEITTSSPSSQMSMDFKLSILEPLIHTGNMDDLGQKSRGIKPIPKYLCFSDNVGSLAYPPANNKNETCKFIRYAEAEDNMANRVSIPNGVVGLQAFYVIMENFLRNCSKHYPGKKTTDGETIFEVQLKEPDDPTWAKKYVEIQLCDLRENSCSFHTCIKILSFIDSKNANYKDNGKFAKDNGELIYKGWGIKEMLIASNFLRAQNIKEIFYPKNTSSKEPPLISLNCGNKRYPAGEAQLECSSGACPNSGNLSLSFFLLKPKNLLIEGIAEIKTIVFKADTVEHIDKKTEYPHMVFLEDEIKEYPYSIILDQKNTIATPDNPKLPCRKVSLDKYSYKRIDDETYLTIYNKFINELSPVNEKLNIYFTGDPVDSYESLKPKLVNISDYPMVETKKITDFNFDNDFDGYSAVFLRHHEAVSKPNLKKLILKSNYFQPLSGQFSINQKLSQFQNVNRTSTELELIKKLFLLELLESIKTKVFIIDERISKIAESHWLDIGGCRLIIGDLYTMMGIHVIDITKDKIHWKKNSGTATWEKLEIKLKSIPTGSPASLTGGKSSIIDLLSPPAKESDYNTFLVIHQGVIDKLGLEYEDSIKAINCKWKVTTSGRGIPENLSASMRFTELSGITTMLSNYDKLGLVQLLYSARHPENDSVNNSDNET